MVCTTLLAQTKTQIANAILGVIFFAISIAAYPAKIFFRENLGERAIRVIDCFIYLIAFCQLGFWTVIISFFAHALVIGSDFEEFSWLTVLLMFPFFSVLFLFWLFRESYKHFKSLYLIQEIDYAKRQHSFYRGESKYFKHLIGKPYKNTLIKSVHIQLFLEPLITLLMGIAVLILDIPLGVALIIGGICFFIDEYEVIRKRRDMILDSLDGEMTALFLEKARNLFKKLEDKDIDLTSLDIYISLKNLSDDGSQNNTLSSQTNVPLSTTTQDTSIIY